MNLHPNLTPEMIRRVLATAGCVALAAFVAVLIGQGQVVYLVMLLGLVGIAVLIAGLGKRIWMLILFGWAISGSLNLFAIPFSIREICIMLGFTGYLCYRILTADQMRVKANFLDRILLLNLLWVAATFFINPVGIRALGAETIGGRPYFNLLLATLAYWAIVRLPDTAKQVSKMPYLLVASSAVVGLLNVVVYVFPSTTPYLFRFYGGLDVSNYALSLPGEEGVGQRWNALQMFGISMVMLMCAAYRPLTLFNALRPRFYGFALGMMAILASGFRNALLWAFASIGIGSLLHRGWRDCVLVGLVGVVCFGAIVAGQGRLFELPFAAQRALAFLPGKWQAAVVEQTEESSASRFEWWRQVVKQGAIRNWWVGDGFGVSQRDFTALSESGSFTEWHTLTGNLHNGPLTAIRYAGVVGLVLIYALMIGAAVAAVRLVRQVRGGQLQVASFFLAIQCLWAPIHYTFVFGAYQYQMSLYILLVSMLRLVQRMAERERMQDAPAIVSGEAPAGVRQIAPVTS